MAVTRERLVEVIRAAYTSEPDLDDDGRGCGCCWGNTCPECAADAVLQAITNNLMDTDQS